MPEQTIRFNRKKHTIQEFMTPELFKAIDKRYKLFRRFEKCPENSPNKKDLKDQYNEFADTIRKAIRARRREFYH